MKRIILFSHWDKHNIIDDCVIDYLKELRKFGDIVFVSDCDLKKDLDKISNICFIRLSIKHGERDFGSWKIGLLKFYQSNLLTDYDELLLVNDSCYLTENAFDKVFQKMENTNCDFWGLTQNKKYSLHLQSYFLCFRHRTFSIVSEFLKGVKKEDDVRSVIHNYEIGLSKLLLSKGFIKSSFIEEFKNDITLNNYALMIKKGVPLIKRRLLVSNPCNVNNLYLFKELCDRRLYNNIMANLKRIGYYKNRWHLTRARLFSRHYGNGFIRYRIFGMRIYKAKDTIELSYD